MIRIFVICIFLSSYYQANSQNGILDSYINTGLRENLALKEKINAYRIAEFNEKEAKGAFFPDINFQARYTVAEGGRFIDFPVGDLLNPVYSTLNMLTGSQDFPSITNDQFYFFRPREQETAIRLIQPIFNPGVYFNHRIQEDLLLVREKDMKAYQRFLISEIKTSYYEYLKTVELLKLYGKTKELVNENLRVNKRLLENDKITIDVVYRSEVEVSRLEHKIAEAEQMNHTAKSYFNFLMNRNFDEEIIVEISDHELTHIDNLEALIAMAISDREELHSLQSYEKMTDKMIRFNRSARWPQLVGSVDYGIQGVDYQLDPEDDFILASLVLQWDLFSGMRNNARIQKANLKNQLASDRLIESEKKIALEVVEAYYALSASVQQIEAKKLEKVASGKAFAIIEKKYEEGKASFLEYMDARNAMIQAEQSLILARYDHLIKYSRLERAACLYSIPEIVVSK